MTDFILDDGTIVVEGQPWVFNFPDRMNPIKTAVYELDSHKETMLFTVVGTDGISREMGTNMVWTVFSSIYNEGYVSLYDPGRPLRLGYKHPFL